MARDRRRIDWRKHQRTNLCIEKFADLRDHPLRIIIGLSHPELQPAIFRRKLQSARHALHKLALIVLRKTKYALES